jgi:hypothetical protein
MSFSWSAWRSRRCRLVVEALEDRRVLSTLVVSPGQSIQQAIDAARPGDTVLVHAGTYPERLVFHHGGDAVSGPITLAAFPGERPLLTGANGPQGFQVLLQDVSYVTVRGFEIAGNKVVDGSGVRVLGSGSHLVISDNFIHDLLGRGAMGITVYGTEAVPVSDLTISGNVIAHCQPGDRTAQGPHSVSSEALTLNGNVAGFQVVGNVVTDVNNIGIDCIGGERDINPDPGLVARDGVVRGNQVFRARFHDPDNPAAGIYVDGGRDIVVEDNLVEGCNLGVEVGAENRGIVASGVTVENNVLAFNQVAGLAFGGFARRAGRVSGCAFVNNTLYMNDLNPNIGEGQLWIQFAENNVVTNNIFVSTRNGGLIASDAGNVNNVLDHNLYLTPHGPDDVDITWNGRGLFTFARYQRVTGQDAHGVFADPHFVAPGADFRLAPGSPAIDAGSSLPGQFAPTDFDGRPRPQGTAPDIGAFEAG